MYPLLRGMQQHFLHPSRCLFPLHFHSLEISNDRSMRDVIVRYAIWPIGDTVHTHLIVRAEWTEWFLSWHILTSYSSFEQSFSYCNLSPFDHLYVEDRPSSLHPSIRLYPSIISSNQLWSRKWQLQITCSYIQWIIQNEYFPLYPKYRDRDRVTDREMGYAQKWNDKWYTE